MLRTNGCPDCLRQCQQSAALEGSRSNDVMRLKGLLVPSDPFSSWSKWLLGCQMSLLSLFHAFQQEGIGELGTEFDYQYEVK